MSDTPWTTSQQPNRSVAYVTRDEMISEIRAMNAARDAKDDKADLINHRKTIVWHMGWIILGTVVTILVIRFGINTYFGITAGGAASAGQEITDLIKRIG